jgi:hypothetical protein
MSVTINASTSSGLVQTADTSGTLEIQSNGTTKLTVLSTGVSGTLVSGTAVASTSGTSIDFTSIPSWVKRITVMFGGVSTSGTSLMQIQLGTGSTTYTTTGYNSGAFTVNTNNSGLVTTGLILNATTAAAANYYGNIIISNLTSNTWVSSHSLGAPSGAYQSMGGGSIALGAALTAVRITTVNGTDTFDAGSINIQYEG